MYGLSNTYFYLVLAIVLVSVVYLIVQLKFPSLTEGFAEKHHGHEKKEGHEKHGAKHGHHPITAEHHAALNTALAQVQPPATPQPTMHLVNKRELILSGNPVVVGNTPTNILENNLAYGPFSYAALESINPMPQNAKILYRIYAIYSDTMTTDGVNKINFDFGWVGNKGSFSVDLARTWGATGYQRDAYSKFFTTDDIKDGGVEDPHDHAIVTANTTIGGTSLGIYRLYVETWLVY
jgi:hypothetical protein